LIRSLTMRSMAMDANATIIRRRFSHTLHPR
jgi:hypothetical protein